MRRLSLRRVSPGSRPRSARILCAVCQVRQIDLADAAHRLAVARHHADRAEIVQDVFGRDRLAANAALGERHVLGDVLVEVVADHQHVEMLVERVHRVRPRRVGRARQHVRLAADPDDVRRVAAAGAFGVVRVNRAALERRDRIVDVARLVQRVGVDRDLDVVPSATAGSSRSPPASCPSPRAASGRSRRRRICSSRPSGSEVLPLPRNPKFIGSASVACSISSTCRAPGVQVVALVPVAGPGAAADERRHAARERLVHLLRADEVDVRVDPAGREDQALAGDRFRRDADDHSVRHAGHHVGIAGLADAGDAPVLDADVGLADAGPVDDERVGDDAVERVDRRGRRRPGPCRRAALCRRRTCTRRRRRVASCSTSATRPVSPSRTRSPVVGP